MLSLPFYGSFLSHQVNVQIQLIWSNPLKSAQKSGEILFIWRNCLLTLSQVLQIIRLMHLIFILYLMRVCALCVPPLACLQVGYLSSEQLRQDPQSVQTVHPVPYRCAGWSHSRSPPSAGDTDGEGAELSALLAPVRAPLVTIQGEMYTSRIIIWDKRKGRIGMLSERVNIRRLWNH